ncbi:MULTISPECIES: hypothetical protein [Flavobacterium]|uniref:Uncharacterized protein n=1 Tax=Flavobacterium jumunjinense TaxID=998845 RepID=A0ABV5GT15_9FLAO|nr:MULTISPECIES: hypothetical protein [Flavobacterium]
MIGNKPFSRPALDELKDKLLDSYNGVRAEPVDTTLNGFHIEKTENKSVGFSVVNNDTAGNSAQANIMVKGSGKLYSNYVGLSYYNNNYYVAAFRNSGLLFSDKTLNLATWFNNPIVFRTGSTFSGTTPKFTIHGNGQLQLGVQPTLNNAVTKLLAIDELGNIVTVDKP